MNENFRNVRVVFSTTAEMIAEREAFVERIWPRLEHELAAQAIAPEPVVVAWGREQGDRESLELLLRAFAGSGGAGIPVVVLWLLGDRYGEVLREVPADLLQIYPFLEPYAGRSLMHAMSDALFGNGTSPAGRALAYLRNDAALAQIPAESSPLDLERDGGGHEQLVQLKAALSAPGTAARTYEVAWNPDTDRLEPGPEFEETLLADALRAINEALESAGAELVDDVGLRERLTKNVARIPELLDEARGDGPAPDPQDLFRRISAQLLERLDLSTVRDADPVRLRVELHQVVEHLVDQNAPQLRGEERDRLVDAVLDETFGLGPLDALLQNDDVQEIFINGPMRVAYRARNGSQPGQVVELPSRFRDREHLVRVIERLTSRATEGPNQAGTITSKTLPAGWQVQLIAGAQAPDGPIVRLCRLGAHALGVFDPAREGSDSVVVLLRSAIAGGRRIVICGPACSGKTALVAALAGIIPAEDRIVTVERAARLALAQPHVVRLLVDRPDDDEPRFDAARMLHAARELKPDWLIVDELDIGTAAGTLDAMQFDGCGVLATVRSRDPAGAVDRLETLLAQSRPQLSATALHRQLAAAVNIVVQTEYTATGEPRVIAMLSVNWLDGEFRLNDMLPKQRVH